LHPIQKIFAIAAAVVTGWVLHALAWPWHAYIPAALLAALGTVGVWVVGWAVARKLSYPRLAREQREAMRKSNTDLSDL